MTEKRVKWVCPHCNHLHFWYWDEGDVFEGETNMNCDKCHRNSKQMMYIDSSSGNAWCEVIKEPVMSELEKLKKQAKEIQQRIEELEKIERQKNKSLHNLIAKWEFYYSERLEKRILQSKNSDTISYRDLVAEEIDNLLNQIEGWIDYQTYLIENSQINYVKGWNECVESIKNRLRGPYDWYEFHKINKEFND